MHIAKWIGLTFNLIFIKVTTAIYFPQNNYSLTISSDLQKGRELLRIFGLPEYNESGEVEYKLGNITSPKGVQQRIFNNYEFDPIFGIQRKTGVVYLRRPISTISDLKEIPQKRPLRNYTEFSLKVFASLVESTANHHSTASVSVGIFVTKPPPLAKQNVGCSGHEVGRRYCFSETPGQLMLQENGSISRFVRLRSLVLEKQCEQLSSKYEVQRVFYKFKGKNTESTEHSITIDNASSEMEVNGSLDRDGDYGGTFTVTVACRLKNDTTNKDFTTDLKFSILDVNDNGPWILPKGQPRTQYQKRTIDLKKRERRPENYRYNLLVKDRDNVTDGTYNVTVEDPRGYFIANENKTTIRTLPFGNSFVIAVVQLADPRRIPTETCSFRVIFNDTTMLPSANASSKAIYDITLKLPPAPTIKSKTQNRCITFRDRDFAMPLSRQAGKYTRLKLFNLTVSPIDLEYQNLTYSITKEAHLKGGFGITPKKGIFFVDTDDFRSFKKNRTSVEVTVLDWKCNRTFQVNVTVILRGPIVTGKGACNTWCAESYEKSDCQKSCGYGAPDGTCRMRESPGMDRSTKYATCSPDLTFCPDAKCDELEKIRDICPQDCTREDPTGCNLSDNSGEKRGISLASTVWCGKVGSKCNCDINPGISTNHSIRTGTPQAPLAGKHGADTTTPKSKDAHTRLAQLQGDDVVKVNANACDHVCRLIIGLSVSSAALLAMVGFIIYRFYIRGARKSDDMKHVSSVVSLNAIPSDYVVDGNDRRQSMAISSHSIEWSPRVCQSVPVDDKWEYPRKHITLEKVLGEGEFGRVLQAKVPPINGSDKECIVAIKMLKNCASVSELRDLLSEFNLLKDVSHPNVIRLLGACTKSGPFYLIVEHCEHGSLKNYLRQKRHVEALYLGPIQPEEPSSEDEYETPIDSSMPSDPASDDVISARDLISFAWQISKGMEYLSSMKLVHRDLAARNVLVAKGKKVKISDFGLTRDIYEADAYTKKTKGRIPVKWMAPESLYDQVYTTKSDVWSFGIVLWEISTLGATPYPGIPPERLFNILKTGYRMERPDNCSHELYSIMSKCWSTAPIDRPSFQDLVSKTEEMLSANVTYLDLTSVIEHIPIVDDKDVEENAAAPRVVNERPKIEEDPEYGSIGILSLDADAYLSPNTHNNREDYDSEINMEEGGPTDGASERTRLLVLDMPREQRQPNDGSDEEEEEEAEKDLLKVVEV